MAHREGIRDYLKDVRLSGKVVDWGCGTKPITNYLGGECEFLGIDKLTHVGADMVKDICEDIVLDEEADMAFCLEVLEHVERPISLLTNIWKNLKVGCPLYFSVPFLYDVHSEQDYWRFTDQGLGLLLKACGFEVVEVFPTTPEKSGWVGKAIRK